MGYFDVFMFLLWITVAAFVLLPLFQRRKAKAEFFVDLPWAKKRISELEDRLVQEFKETYRLRALIHEQGDTHRRGLARIGDDFHRFSLLAHWIQDDRDAAEAEIKGLKDEVEKMHVQMAAVSVAAWGGTKDPATRGMYGWSVPYQDVLELRRKYEGLRDQPLSDRLRSTKLR